MSRFAKAVAAIVLLGAAGAGLYYFVLRYDGDPAVGEVRLLRVADSAFDDYLLDSDERTREFIADSYWRMRGFAPTFDPVLEFAPPSSVSVDAYALYTNPAVDPAFSADLIEEHPDWVLRDPEGEPLYIPFGCEGGTCPQFAADFGNPEWRSHFIESTRELVDAGYEGVHVDDVNMEFRVGNGDGEFVAPIDPRTGEEMTLEDWRRYMAEFMEEVREAFPDSEISHNALWFAGHDDPFVQRQLKAADLIQLERGFGDPGLVAGTGEFGFDRLVEQVEWLHDEGIGAIFQPYDLDEETAEYELAGYFLTGDGGDGIATTFKADPRGLWPGWTLDLGAPTGEFEREGTVLRREFENGLVLLNPPGAESAEVDLGGVMTTIGGEPVESVELSEREGAVLSG